MRQRITKELAGLSPIVYHVTGLHKLENILKHNAFFLASGFGEAESGMVGRIGDYFFLSTARTRNNRYFKYLVSGEVILELDGRKLGQRYKAAPVDYWGENFRKVNPDYEQEDRVFSRKSTIPNAISYIKSISILVASENEAIKKDKPIVLDKTIFELLKKSKIPIFIYASAADIKLGNKKKALPIDSLVIEKSDGKNYFVTDERKMDEIKLGFDFLISHYEALTDCIKNEKEFVKDSVAKYFEYPETKSELGKYHDYSTDERHLLNAIKLAKMYPSPELNSLMNSIATRLRKSKLKNIVSLGKLIYEKMGILKKLLESKPVREELQSQLKYFVETIELKKHKLVTNKNTLYKEKEVLIKIYSDIYDLRDAMYDCREIYYRYKYYLEKAAELYEVYSALDKISDKQSLVFDFSNVDKDFIQELNDLGVLNSKKQLVAEILEINRYMSLYYYKNPAYKVLKDLPNMVSW